MRLTSEFFVAALMRRCFAENAYASVVSRGSAEAGAVLILVDRRDGTFDLYTPAPQSMFDQTTSGTRLFEVRLSKASRDDVDSVISSERRMDSDIWIVEIDDRAGRRFWEVAED